MDATRKPSFGETHFGTAALGDERRRQRLVRLADQILQHPEGTLPSKLHDPASYQAMYRLCKNPQVTHAAVIDPHCQLTRQRMRQHPRRVLLIHDTTELDYTSKQSLADQLGQIGDGRGRGYECHNSLAVDALTGEVLGLANQILHHRAAVPPKETPVQRRQRESRESRLWVEGSQAVGPPPADRCWIDVADRAADTFEFLAYEQQAGKRYVIRSKHNRSVRADADGQPTDEAFLLHDRVRQLPARARKTVAVSAQPGRQARTARLQVTWMAVWLWPPQVRKGDYEPAPLRVWVVRAWEPEPPPGEEALEWILLTNIPVTSAPDALDRLSCYEKRPTIEEYHKAQKTGCGIENPQFTQVARLEPMIGLLSVVAVMLLNLRWAARQAERAAEPARAVVPPLWVEVLSTWRFHEVRLDLTVAEFFLALARLGGHQNRTTDRPPGWLILWRGWNKLNTMLDYALALRERKSD